MIWEATKQKDGTFVGRRSVVISQAGGDGVGKTIRIEYVAKLWLRQPSPATMACAYGLSYSVSR